MADEGGGIFPATRWSVVEAARSADPAQRRRALEAIAAVGAILGAFDGMTAWFTPSVRDQIGTIVMLSSIKSVFAGLLIGAFAIFIHKRVAIALFGLAVGLLFAYLVAMQPDPKTGEHFYAQIMIPGAIVGLLVGYATARYSDKTDRLEKENQLPSPKKEMH